MAKWNVYTERHRWFIWRQFQRWGEKRESTTLPISQSKVTIIVYTLVFGFFIFVRCDWGVAQWWYNPMLWYTYIIISTSCQIVRKVWIFLVARKLLAEYDHFLIWLLATFSDTEHAHHQIIIHIDDSSQNLRQKFTGITCLCLSRPVPVKVILLFTCDLWWIPAPNQTLCIFLNWT